MKRQPYPISSLLSRWRRLAGALLGALGWLFLLSLSGHSTLASLAAPSSPPLLPSSHATPYPNCRFGVGTTKPLTTYDVTPLNLGWYLNWNAVLTPSQSGGVEFMQLVNVQGTSYFPSGNTLATIIAANPGSWWLIGNEPDCIYQDNVSPEAYAQAYHDAYFFIKAHDPTAQVAVGGIVQPTPLRMQYLDRVLTHYAASYQSPLPTDGWSIHTFILREASCAAHPDSCWGAEIPPGISASEGMLYDIQDTDSLTIFQERIIQFRRWMRDRGYRNTPLLITEYGTLMPHTYVGWTKERAAQFMTGTFNFLLNASDATIGYPADENRLVQRWLWYSLDDMRYGGYLFNANTGAPEMAPYFSAYTAAITPAIDLAAVALTQNAVPFSPAEPVTLTLLAEISNVGNVAVTQPIQVKFLDAGGNPIGAVQILSAPLKGCAATGTVSVTWTNVTPGAHQVRVVVDPQNDIVEATKSNNELMITVLVATHQTYLPLVLRKR